MNARTKLKRAEQARKRRAKISRKMQWKSMRTMGSLGDILAECKPFPTREKSWLEKLMDKLTQPAPNDNSAGDSRPV
jgi:hypothetical protein